MADLDTLERSIEESRPIELYEFQIGTSATRYTSAEQDVVYNGFTWEAVAIRRNGRSLSSQQEANAMVLKLPTSDPIASLFYGIQPAARLTCKIYRIQTNMTPPTAILVFDGYVASTNFRNEEASLQLTPNNKAVKRQIPRYSYQGLCNHTLYDRRCGLLATDFKYTGLVNALVSNVLTISGLGASAPVDAYIGGYVETTTGDEQRLILDQSTDSITILLPFEQGVLGTNINVFRGCDHTNSTCINTFSNGINYGGCPFVPTSNPFTLTSFTKE